jgi:cell division initiation protein
MVTPLDIQRKEFRRVFRGYDEQEVDEFLDRVAVELERLSRENEELRARGRLADKPGGLGVPETGQPAAGWPGPGTAGLALDEVKLKVGALRREVEQILGAASVEAAQRVEEILLHAENRLGELVAQIEHEAERVLGEAEERLERLITEAAHKFRFLASGETGRSGPAPGRNLGTRGRNRKL